MHTSTLPKVNNYKKYDPTDIRQKIIIKILIKGINLMHVKKPQSFTTRFCKEQSINDLNLSFSVIR